MIPPGQTRVTLRLWALSAFLFYLFAGSSLALPTQDRCGRCAKFATAGTVKPGTSCPLSRHGHDCHDTHKRTGGKITLCPDGCVHHDGQGGEIPPLAKFVSTPASGLPARLFVARAAKERSFAIQDPSFPVPQHPPTRRVLSVS